MPAYVKLTDLLPIAKAWTVTRHVPATLHQEAAESGPRAERVWLALWRMARAAKSRNFEYTSRVVAALSGIERADAVRTLDLLFREARLIWDRKLSFTKGVPSRMTIYVPADWQPFVRGETTKTPAANTEREIWPIPGHLFTPSIPIAEYNRVLNISRAAATVYRAAYIHRYCPLGCPWIPNLRYFRKGLRQLKDNKIRIPEIPETVMDTMRDPRPTKYWEDKRRYENYPPLKDLYRATPLRNRDEYDL